MLDFIIVGSGIAGSMLAWHLVKAGKQICVFDEGETATASYAASGVINPITGKRFVKSWLIDELQPYAKQCYRAIETELGVSFLQELSIYHILNSIEEVNDWSAKANTKGYECYLPSSQIHFLETNKVLNKHGCFEVQGALKIETEVFLNTIKDWLAQNNFLQKEKFNEDKLNVRENFIEYNGLKAEKLIFANGYKAANSEYFKDVEFSPVKGEGLIIHIENFYNNIVHGDVMISPTNSPNLHYVGSTYEWKFEDNMPTKNKRNELVERIKKTISCRFEVVEHVAGIRPASNNRRPIIGFLPKSNIGIFNGMGTKGFSLSPFFAKHFCEHLVEQKNLMSEVDVKRFFLKRGTKQTNDKNNRY